ncbi:MAG: ABC transporter ATP-binding protein [Cyanobacteria bacterium P01_E01_bin.42]
MFARSLGCGKTTILRAIAGFDRPYSGEIWIRGQLANELPPYRRPVNTVFQSYALFNHLTVRENIAFSLKLKKCPRMEREERVKQAIAQVKLEKFADRHPDRLSGGQKQRVALARALIDRPTVLLLDEPLGALDFQLRKEMQAELSRLHREMGLTFLMVTHDREEALSLSDRLAVLQHGHLEQVGSPREIYQQPRTPFVAGFIGETNLLPSSVNEAGNIVTEKGLLLAREDGIQAGNPLMFSIRPEKIKLAREPLTYCETCFSGRIQAITYLGDRLEITIGAIATGDTFRVRQTESETECFSVGMLVYLGWQGKDRSLFNAARPTEISTS